LDFRPRIVETTGGVRLLLRKVTAADAPLMYTFLNELSRKSRSWFSPHPFDYSNVRAMVKDANPRNLRLVLVQTEGQLQRIVGQASYKYRDVDPGYPIVGLVIADAFQNQGLGQLLMKELADKARKAGYQGLSLNVFKDNARALHVYAKAGYRFAGETDDLQQWHMRLTFDESGALRWRGIYLHPIPYGLRHLTADTFLLEEWQEYLRLIQGAGANFIKVFIWPHQYYHPRHPETAQNRFYWEILRQALAYAREIGLRTYVGLSYNLAPPYESYRHPEWLAPDAAYPGVTFCWQKAKALIKEYAAQTMAFFESTTDGYVLWFHDPGFCTCRQCNPFERTAPDVIQTYRDLLPKGKQLLFSLWQVEALSRGEFGAKPSPNLPQLLLDAVERDSPVFLPEIQSDLWEKALLAGLQPVHFAFFLDPEEGTERYSIWPQPRFKQVLNTVQAVREAGGAGVMGYRLTPYTQFASDYVLLQAGSKERLDLAQALRALALHLLPGPRQSTNRDNLVRAIWHLDNALDYGKANALHQASKQLALLRPPFPTRFPLALQQVTSVFSQMARLGRKEKKPEAVARELLATMEGYEYFQAYTYDKVWPNTRAYDLLIPRVRWWLAFLEEKGLLL